MASNTESLGVSGILPSTTLTDQDANDLYNSEPVDDTREEVDSSATRRFDGRSIHVRRSQQSTIEPTIIPNTHASFRLRVCDV